MSRSTAASNGNPSDRIAAEASTLIDPTRRKHALVFVAITVFLDIAGLGLILPVLPKLLVELTGNSVNEVSRSASDAQAARIVGSLSMCMRVGTGRSRS